MANKHPLLLSLILHAIFVAVFFWGDLDSPRPLRSDGSGGKVVRIRLNDNTASMSGDVSGVPKQVRARKLRQKKSTASKVDIHKLFALSPQARNGFVAEESPGDDTVGETIRYTAGGAVVGAQAGTGAGALGHGSVWYELQGDPEDRPLLDAFAKILHAHLSYPKDLYHLHPQGEVHGEIGFNRKQGFVARHMELRSSEKYLGVHLIHELFEMARNHKVQFKNAAQGDEDRKITLKVSFKSGANKDFKNHPLPQVSREQIQAIRHFHDPQSIDLGFAKLNLSESNAAKKLGLNFGFAVESLVDSDFRKRYGWDGNKQIRAREEALRIKYSQLLKKYVSEGYLKI